MNKNIVLSNIYNNNIINYRWYPCRIPKLPLIHQCEENKQRKLEKGCYLQSDFIDVREHTKIINITPEAEYSEWNWSYGITGGVERGRRPSRRRHQTP